MCFVNNFKFCDGAHRRVANDMLVVHYIDYKEATKHVMCSINVSEQVSAKERIDGYINRQNDGSITLFMMTKINNTREKVGINII